LLYNYFSVFYSGKTLNDPDKLIIVVILFVVSILQGKGYPYQGNIIRCIEFTYYIGRGYEI